MLKHAGCVANVITFLQDVSLKTMIHLRIISMRVQSSQQTRNRHSCKSSPEFCVGRNDPESADRLGSSLSWPTPCSQHPHTYYGFPSFFHHVSCKFIGKRVKAKFSSEVSNCLPSHALRTLSSTALEERRITMPPLSIRN